MIETKTTYHQLIESLELFAKFKSENFKNKDYKYNSVEELVLNLGRRFYPRNFNKKEYPTAKSTMKECFSNAQDLLLKTEDLTYVEGYIYYHIPILHAWLIDSEGTVIDPTLRDSENYVYFGIPLQKNYVLETTVEKGTYGVIENWEMRYPMLKGNESEYLKS